MTMLPNSFVDYYMANANGEFVKVYLFLLRHVEDAASSLSISMIRFQVSKSGTCSF